MAKGNEVGFWAKAGLLALLVLQNCALNVCARWSRVIASAPAEGGEDEGVGKLAGGYAKTSLVLVRRHGPRTKPLKFSKETAPISEQATRKLPPTCPTPLVPHTPRPPWSSGSVRPFF